MRILFAGSPGIAVLSLKTLDENSGFTLAGLLTNPDSPKGRSGNPEPTECAAAAADFFGDSVPVLKPEKLDGTARSLVSELKPDILVSFAYGKIFGPKFLSLFPMGGINIHPSLLPKYRGPTPIPAAIINRDSETGITIQRLAEQMDSGDILVQESMPLNGRETTACLNKTMSEKAAELLVPVLKQIAAGTSQTKAQDHHSATYCHLIKKEDGIINWQQSAIEIDARIRAFNPWPLSLTKHRDLELFILKAEPFEATLQTDVPHSSFLIPNLPGKVLGKDNNKGILIQTGEGILAVCELQYRSKKALEWKTFLNGARNFIGAKLG